MQINQIEWDRMRERDKQMESITTAWEKEFSQCRRFKDGELCVQCVDLLRRLIKGDSE